MAAIKKVITRNGLRTYLKLTRVKIAYNKVSSKTNADIRIGHETTGANACQKVKLYSPSNTIDTRPDNTGADIVILLTTM